METPYIQIKFVPLIKTLVKNNSHYNLKIIPVVPRVEHINKIKWRDIKNKVEYTVPISCRIVIIKDSPRQKCVKIYHSCVDIVTSKSLLALALSPGKIKKSLSEYSISNKRNESSQFANIPTFDINVSSKLNLINNIDIFLKAERKKINPFKTHNSELDLLSYENPKLFKKNVNNEVFGMDFESSKSSNFMQFNIEKYEFNKLQILSNNMKSLESNTVGSRMDRTDIEEIKWVKPDYSRNIENRIKPTKNTFPILVNNLIQSNLKDYSIINRTSTKFQARILPEIRVANFVKNMKMEIRPLKIILNDIIKKCVESDLYTLLKFKSLVNKNTSDCYKHVCDVKNNKTNRVVYSFVFHEG